MKAGPQADLVYLNHMLESIARVLAYCKDGEASFRRSSLIQDAVIRNLQTMAESSQRLSESAKTLAPEVPWRALSGFRNIIVHDYLGVDLDVVWQVVAHELPALQKSLQAVQTTLARP